MTVDAIATYPQVNSGTTVNTDTLVIFPRDLPPARRITIAELSDLLETSELVPGIRVLSQTGILFSDFTDGGSTVGTLTTSITVPAGAILLGSKVLVPAGFAGDTSAALIIGDGSDTDRYMTGTPSVFATAATGIQTGVPSGNKLLTTANSPVLTVTTNADFTSVSAGELDVHIYYIATV